MPDIDIDFADRSQILDKIKHRVATLENSSKHNTGVYVTEIPHNPLNLLATINYKEAEDKGYFKLDFLNVSIYKGIRDEDHLYELMNREPMWELLEHQDFTDKVFHIAGHHQICQTLKPKSVKELAAVLAIIRPAKRYLLNESWEVINREVWKRPEDDSYFFKKSHGISYAVAVVVHMNLLCEQLQD